MFAVESPISSSSNMNGKTCSRLRKALFVYAGLATNNCCCWEYIISGAPDLVCQVQQLPDYNVHTDFILLTNTEATEAGPERVRTRRPSSANMLRGEY